MSTILSIEVRVLDEYCHVRTTLSDIALLVLSLREQTSITSSQFLINVGCDSVLDVLGQFVIISISIINSNNQLIVVSNTEISLQ